MSTRTSKDIILERSSTRLHAPPGGQSSISFGSYETEKPTPRNYSRNGQSSITFGDSQNDVEPPRNYSRNGQSSITFGDSQAADPVKSRQYSNKGQSSITFGESEANQQSRRNQSNNGKSSIVFGDSTGPEKPYQRSNQRDTNPLENITNSSLPNDNQFRRVRQAPGGTSTIVIG